MGMSMHYVTQAKHFISNMRRYRARYKCFKMISERDLVELKVLMPEIISLWFSNVLQIHH